SCGPRGLECRFGIPSTLVPGSGPAVQDRHELGVVFGQLAPKQITEEMVVAIPNTLSVEGNEEEIGSFHLLELLPGPLVLEHRVAQRSAHRPEHRRPLEEPPLARTEAPEIFRSYVVG